MADNPDVPAVAGVPLLSSFSAGQAVALMTADGDLGPFGADRWGLFQNGAPVIVADTVNSFEFRNESQLVDHPLERGSFESYNKVASPYDARIRFMAGSMAMRQQMIETIDRIAGDLQLYEAVTPEKTYVSVNVTHYDFRRTAQAGAGLLTIDVWVREVRLLANAGSAPTAAPSGAAASNGGTVQPTDATAAQADSSPAAQLARGEIVP